MRKDILINLNITNNKVTINNKTLGISSENLQGQIIFKPEPFVDGVCRLYVDGKGSILMDKQEDCYTVNILSSLLTEDSLDVCFKITEPETDDGIPIFCSKIMHFRVLETIDSSSTIPEDYPSWEQTLDSLIAEFEQIESTAKQAEIVRNTKVDNAVSQVQDLTYQYNQNAVEKTNAFNTNASNKTNNFNNNVTDKIKKFDNDTDTILEGKKDVLDNYEQDKEAEIDEYTNTIKSTLDTYEKAKENELNNHTNNKKTEITNYTTQQEESFKSNLDDYEATLEENLETKETELETVLSNKKDELEEAFNNNATEKTNDFNDNAIAKTAKFDEHTDEIQTEINDLKTLVDTELDTNEVEGTEIDVNDSAECRGSIIPGGNMEQEQLSGKNLLNVGNFSLLKSSNRTLQIAIGTELPVGTYAFSCKLSNGNLSINNGLNIVLKNAQLTNISNTIQTKLNSGNFSGIFTITEIASKIYFYIAQGEDDNATIALSDLQIEQGSIPTDFEPYCGGQPSPNPDYPQQIKVVTGDNVVKHCGKNLLDLEKWLKTAGKTNVGGTYTLIDNGFIINFNANADAYIGRAQSAGTVCLENEKKSLIEAEENAKYTLSCSSMPRCYVCFYDENYTSLGYQSIAENFNATSYTFTTPIKTKYIAVRLGIKNANYTSYSFTNILLEKNSVATPYEPYREESFEVNLGKNLFDKDNANIINAGISSNKISTSEYNRVLYIPVKSSTTYTIQKRNDGDVNRFRVGSCTVIPADNVSVPNSIENDNATNITITTGVNDKYLAVMYYRTYETLLTEQQILDSIQIEEGSTATSYSEYFTPIELCKIGDYEDTIFKNVVGDKNYNAELEEGAWYKKGVVGKIVLKGTENFAAIDSNTKYLKTLTDLGSRALISAKNSYRNLTHCFSNYFVESTQDNVAKLDNGVAFSQWTNSQYLYFSKFLDTAAEFNTWLANKYAEGDPVVICYPLEVPIYEQITDPTLISQLEALNKAKWFKGINHWWTETEKLKPDLKCTYKVSNKLKNQNEIANLQAQIDELKIALAGTGEITVASANIADKSAELEVAEGEVE